jgi:hypothetical protein
MARRRLNRLFFSQQCTAWTVAISMSALLGLLFLAPFPAQAAGLRVSTFSQAHRALHALHPRWVSSNVFDATFTGSCKSWTERADSNNYDEEWTPSNGSTNCAQAVASWNANNISIAGCDYFVWVPSWDANAQFTPSVTDIYGNVYQGAVVNENDYTDQWAFIGQFNNGDKISITDANGQSGTFIGLGGNYHHGTQTDTYRVDC